MIFECRRRIYCQDDNTFKFPSCTKLAINSHCTILQDMLAHAIHVLIGQNIDGQHLRPPVLAILLETVKRENFDGLIA